MNSVVFTQEYLQLTLLPVNLKLQFFSVLERGSQTETVLSNLICISTRDYAIKLLSETTKIFLHFICVLDLVAFTSTLNPWSQSGETAIQHEQFCTMFTLMDFKIRHVPSLCRRNQRHNTKSSAPCSRYGL
jgi:hypothetical protein